MIDIPTGEYWLDTPLKDWRVRLRGLSHLYHELQDVEKAGIKYTLETDILSLGMLIRVRRVKQERKK